MSEPLGYPKAAGAATQVTAHNFRLGEDDMSDASDTDQSVRSERSVSPLGGSKGMSKSKKKKARKQVGALTDELDILLKDAFQPPKEKADDASVTNPQADGDQPMRDDTMPTTKKMSSRTRQNLAKVEHRRRLREQKQKETMQTGVTNPVAQKFQPKKNVKQARKERKLRQKAKKAAQKADAMEIG